MKMKKFRMLLCLFFGAVVMFGSCSSDSDDSTPPANSVDIPKYTSGKILKNKVINKDSNDEYFEYLTFTSETTGSYALYKNGISVPSTPTTFTYDSSTGKFTVGSSTAYLFQTKKDNASVFVYASEEMTCSSDKPSLYAKWTISDGSAYTFDSEFKVTIKPSSSPEFSVSYSNDNGWILAGNSIPFFFSANNKMYYLAYETKSEYVNEVGRFVAGNEIELNLPVFIYAGIQL